MSRDLRRDDRALALGVVIFFIMLITAAVLYTLFSDVLTQVFTDMLGRADHQGATDQINREQAIWNNVLIGMLVLSMVFLIGRAVQEAKSP